jgi:hypothetical protein
MSVEFRAGDPDDARLQIGPRDRGLRDAVGRDGRRNSHRQRGDAADAGFEANIAVAVVGSGPRSRGKVAVADNATLSIDGLSRALGGAKAGNDTRKRNRVSRDERHNALPQWPFRERHAYNPPSTPRRPRTS